MLTISTSYFSKIKTFNDSFELLCIARLLPEWCKPFNIITYRPFVPPKQLVLDYKNDSITEAQYVEHYNTHILGILDPKIIIDELTRISQGRHVILFCYEHPRNFCHRKLVGVWLKNNGITCNEYDHK